MKLKQKTYNFILLLALLSGGFAPFRFGAAAENYEPQTSVQAVELSEPVLAVAALPVQPEIVMGSASCGVGLPALENLAQDTALFNLNQPADCFSLAVGTARVSTIIAVGQLPEQKPIAVVSRHPIYTPAHYTLPWPAVDFSKALPAISIALALLVILVALRLYTERYSVGNEAYPFVVFERYQILRC